MKLIIAGSRSIKSERIVGEAINLANFPYTELVSGGAEGVDIIAERFASDIKSFYIDDWVWKALGKKAGPLRNKAMAEYADALLAIWDGQSSGTYNMILTMQALKKPVKVFLVEKDKLIQL